MISIICLQNHLLWTFSAVPVRTRSLEHAFIGQRQHRGRLAGSYTRDSISQWRLRMRSTHGRLTATFKTQPGGRPQGLGMDIETTSREVSLDVPKACMRRRGLLKGAADFNFLTDKLRVDHTHLGTRQLKARVFHFMCTPRRCIDFVENILKQRRQVLEAEGESAVSPYFIWEPVPDACSPQELAGVEEALKYIDVVSPNHHELAMLYAATQSPRGAKDDMDKMKEQCEKLWNAWERQGRDRAIVVRCGEQGCFLKTETKQFILPAYHEPPSDSGHPKVVDPTGAGNAFLGAFAMGMLDSPDPSQKILHAGLYGTIAASFAIEQVGLPKLRIIEGVEVWNGVRVEQRLQELRNR